MSLFSPSKVNYFWFPESKLGFGLVKTSRLILDLRGDSSHISTVCKIAFNAKQVLKSVTDAA